MNIEDTKTREAANTYAKELAYQIVELLEGKPVEVNMKALLLVVHTCSKSLIRKRPENRELVVADMKKHFDEMLYRLAHDELQALPSCH